jgi:hypothetical protein
MSAGAEALPGGHTTATHEEAKIIAFPGPKGRRKGKDQVRT